MKPRSIDDGSFLFAQDAEGKIVNLAAPSRRVVAPPPRVRGIWAKVGLHAAAALRLRRTLTQDRVRDALLDPSGKVADAGGSIKDDPSAKESLSRAVRAMDQARSAEMRSSPDALTLWQGLVGGKWSLVEHWESGGSGAETSSRVSSCRQSDGGVTACHDEDRGGGALIRSRRGRAHRGRPCGRLVRQGRG